MDTGTRVDQIEDNLCDLARDISAWLRPPRRRVFRWLRWKFTQQPADVLEAVSAAAWFGDTGPLRRAGIVIE